MAFHHKTTSLDILGSNFFMNELWPSGQFFPKNINHSASFDTLTTFQRLLSLEINSGLWRANFTKIFDIFRVFANMTKFWQNVKNWVFELSEWSIPKKIGNHLNFCFKWFLKGFDHSRYIFLYETHPRLLPKKAPAKNRKTRFGL